MFGKKKIEVNAILDNQIESLLKETGQFEDFINGNILCESCKTIITVQNIGIIQPIKDGKKVLFYCDSKDCIEEYKNSKW